MRPSSLLAVVAACGTRPAPPAPSAAPTTPVATTPPDAAAAPPVEEVAEEEAPIDPLEDLGATLSARPFRYLYRHTADVALAVHWTQVAPERSFDETRVVYAAVPPGGPSLVCVKGEICWSFEGEMDWLWVPEDLNATAYPYLYLVAIMPDRGRVDLWQPVDGASARPEPTSDPARTVDSFEPDAAPAWARPWIDFLDPIDDDVQITSGTTPIPHVFVGREATGRLCIAGVDRFRCGEPVPTGAAELTVSYSLETIDLGSGVVAIGRNLRGELDGVGYVSASAKLLFDVRDPDMPWIATIPELGFARLPQRKDESFPLLQLWREWEVVGTTPLDLDCFELRRAKGAYARRVVGIGDLDTPIVKKAKLPKYQRPRLVPTDATAAWLAAGWDFAGRWGLAEGGGLEPRKRCSGK